MDPQKNDPSKLDMRLARIKPYAPVVLRIGMSLVFFCFSYYQFSDPAAWIAFVPAGVAALFGGNALLIVHLNAWFELIAGAMLLAGFQVRTAAILLALHLVGIASTLGISPLGVRDFGLAIATFSVFFSGHDRLSLDRILCSHSMS